MTTPESATLRVNWGCGPYYADGWTNLDAHEGDGVHPDIVVDASHPFATFPDGTVDRVYAGHVLEHCYPSEVAAHLTDIRRVLRPGGRVLVVGPDVHRTLERWRDGLESWSLVLTVLEGEDDGTGPWPEASHKWDCHSQRVIDMLAASGFAGARDVPIGGQYLDGWPVTSRAPWQMACIGTNP